MCTLATTSLLVEEMATGQFACCQHGIPTDGTIIIISCQLLCSSNSKPTQSSKYTAQENVINDAQSGIQVINNWINACNQDMLSPSLHVADNAKVVLVSAHSALDLMEKISQLHEDNQACHGQPDITEELTRETSTENMEDLRSKIWTDSTDINRQPPFILILPTYEYGA